MLFVHSRYWSFLKVLLGLTALALLAHFAWTLGLGRPWADELANTWIYSSVSVATAAICLVRAAILPRRRLAWAALGLGLAFTAFGDAYWDAAYTGASSVPDPSLADAAYLATYPFLCLGLWLLIRDRGMPLTPGALVDGLLTGLAVAAVSSALLAPALAGIGGGQTAKVLTDLSYPLWDLILASFLVGALVYNGRRPDLQLGLIFLGIGAWAVADGIYLYQSAVGSYVEGTPLDSIWLLGNLSLAAAALAPPERIAAAQPGRSIAFPILASAAAIGVLVWDHFERLTVSSVVLAGLTLGAVSVRLLVSFAENRRLLDQVHREAVTDSLTGLRNRRSLLADLEARLAATGRPFLFAFFDLDGFKAYNDTFGHPAGDLLLQRLGEQLQRAVAPDGTAYRLGGDEFCVITETGSAGPHAALTPALAALTETGPGFSIGASYGSVLLPVETASPEDALGIADRRMYATKGQRMSAVQNQSRSLLLRVMSESKPGLREHLHDVASLAVGAARRLGCDEEELNRISTAAEMHDIGKIAIPDEMLTKSEPLDKLEWGLMRTHTVIGERILNAAPALAPVARIVRSSHERWDGKGYPDGLAGEQIPFGSRLVYICDAYDAMTEERPYSPALSTEQAMAELRRHAGTQFDPVLVEAVCLELEERISGEEPEPVSLARESSARQAG
ncbi:MAG TPA: diguanylate cyclase [Solirubrobacterales bacterium]